MNNRLKSWIGLASEITGGQKRNGQQRHYVLHFLCSETGVTISDKNEAISKSEINQRAYGYSNNISGISVETDLINESNH
jgi:hypothetical protein